MLISQREKGSRGTGSCYESREKPEEIFFLLATVKSLLTSNCTASVNGECNDLFQPREPGRARFWRLVVLLICAENRSHVISSVISGNRSSGSGGKRELYARESMYVDRVVLRGV